MTAKSKYTDDDLIEKSKQASSISEIIKLLNLNSSRRTYCTIRRKLKNLNIVLISKKKAKKFFSKEEVYTINSEVSNTTLRRHYIKDNKKYECVICNINNWQNKNLTLEIDHINGIRNDNRIENLRFLCPNCHSQTDTYSNKNGSSNKNRIDDQKKIDISYCDICNIETRGYGEICNNCRIEQSMKFYVSKEELQNLIDSNLSIVKISKMFNVSDNAIRKRCKKFKISINRKAKKNVFNNNKALGSI